MVALMIIETALIGSLASLGVDSRTQAIATVPFLSISISLPQLLAFTMISLGLGEEFKDDMYVPTPSHHQPHRRTSLMPLPAAVAPSA